MTRRLRDRLRRRSGRPTGSSDDRRGRDVNEILAGLLDRHDSTTRPADAAVVADEYVTYDDGARRLFLETLAREFWTSRAEVDAAASALAGAGDGTEARLVAELRLRDALTPPATDLVHLFTGLDGGVKLLVDLRADLLRIVDEDPALRALDRELHAHLATLFDVGLLKLRRITWDSPASLLERLIEYEAVHAIDSWGDLKNRLDSDRRCYAFFHPAMPAEPLVFVEIALTAGAATHVARLLDEDAPDLDPEHADTAVFYSISSCQPGLAGVNLGNALIKQVVEQLRHDLPNVTSFVTLSPIPTFRPWVDDVLGRDALSAYERDLLPAKPARVVARLDDEDWATDQSIGSALTALCARYLTTTIDGRVLDPVANFHLSNGALLERVLWGADPSPAGRARSASLMANYVYEPERIAERAEAYTIRGDVARSDAVRDLTAD
ncbi:MAG: malonyl-CoA decarboxylase domain-containing protein [Actinomycetota bacterium]